MNTPLGRYLIHADPQAGASFKAGDKTLFVDSEFDQYKFATQEGVIAAAPKNCPHGLKVGDTVYFTHLVVQKNRLIEVSKTESYYLCEEDEIFATMTAEGLKSVGRWAITTPVTQAESFETIGNVKLFTASGAVDKFCHAKVIATNGKTTYKPGDTIIHIRDADYRIKVNGEVFSRTLGRHIMAIAN
jgi:hypothetical protein